MTADPTEKMVNNNTLVVTECPAGDTSLSLSSHSESEVPLAVPCSLQAEVKEFQWSKSLQGVLLGCFFYGYILTQIIGGYFSDKVSAGFMFPNIYLNIVPSVWWQVSLPGGDVDAVLHLDVDPSAGPDLSLPGVGCQDPPGETV